MDDRTLRWQRAQIRRAEWAVLDIAMHMLPPHTRKPLQGMLERLTREKDAAIAAYNELDEPAAPQDVEGEPDGYDTCDFCGAVVLKAALVDAGPEFGLTVAGCMICDACVSSERTAKMERDEMARDYDDEIGGVR